MNGRCESCNRNLELTEHHLIPKEMHNKKWCRKLFTIKEMNTKIVMVCHDCHAAFHKFISNKDLAKNYNTLKKLMENQEVKKFVDWVKQNDKRKFKY